MAKAYGRLRFFLFGRPLPNEHLEHERLNKTAPAVMRVLPLLLLVVEACGSPHGNRLEDDRQSDQTLVGTWDASLFLTRSYPLEPRRPDSRRICGTIGFVANHGAGGFGLDSLPVAGVYDLDLSQLGLNWLDDKSYPIAVASVDANAKAGGVAREYVTIVLNPDSRERIALRGRHDGVGIDGNWVAQSARGTAAGVFSLRPHGVAREGPSSC